MNKKPTSEELRSLLAHNLVAFTFVKVNGEMRNALGTRNLDLARAYTDTNIPTPKGEENPNAYYDVNSEGWRSWKEGNIVSIDAVIPFTLLRMVKTKPAEPAKREIPISRPADTPADTDNVPKGFDLGKIGKIVRGIGGGVPQGEIRKAMDELGKDIDLVPPAMGGGFGGGFGIGGGAPISGGKVGIGSPISGGEGGKVGTPYHTEEGVALPLGNIPIEVFAKMVAHYVVDEFIERIK